MATFKSLTEIQRYLEQNAMEVLKGSMALERVLANTMSQSVIDVVYNAYPEGEASRRGEKDYGLADPRNGEISDVIIESNGKVRLIFENIAEGEDTLKGEILIDTIEEGIKSNWNNPDGVWSEPRRAMEEASNRIRQNPSEVVNAIKQGLRERGMKVR